jgi:hypothetical protein
MADKKVHDYAGGWITGRTDTDAPAFLKFVLPIVAIAGVIYTIIFMNGEIHHSTRGNLVQQMNAATGTANVFMYLVAALIAIFFVILTVYLFSKPHQEE